MQSKNCNKCSTFVNNLNVMSALKQHFRSFEVAFSKNVMNNVLHFGDRSLNNLSLEK